MAVLFLNFIIDRARQNGKYGHFFMTRVLVKNS